LNLDSIFYKDEKKDEIEPIKDEELEKLFKTISREE
jgi:hypothetical protein